MKDNAWTVAEAKAHLSEILRRAASEGPQRIGTQKRFVVVPEAVWDELSSRKRQPLGAWLVDNVPKGVELELPSRVDPPRPAPFDDD